MASDITLEQLLSEPILSSHHAHYALENYLTKRIKPFALPDPNTWEAEAERLRRRVLDEVIFRGVPDSWRSDALEVEWTDTIETDRGYRIRKLRYLALPGLWIPALLYEPDEMAGRVSVVLNVNGHVGPPGKAIDYKQLRCINLAKRGMIALNPEWMKFGELQGVGYEHNRAAYLDICGVAGVSVFYLAMRRGLDLLLTHDHADTSRVAVTGLSGGGWQTIILSALDTRVTLAAPNAGYVGLDVRVRNRGDIGDIEQNPADLVAIADYPMLTAMLAPRPALLLYNQDDDCCFQTERAKPSVYEPVKPLYEALGRADAFLFHNNTDPGTHNYDLDNRQQFYRFINRHFLGTDSAVDEEIPSAEEVLSEEELTVGVPENNADFVSLASDIAATLPRRSWPHGSPDDIEAWQADGQRRLRDLLRYQPLEVTENQSAGERVSGDRRMMRYTLQLGEEWSLPALDITPQAQPDRLLIVTADQGYAATQQLVSDALADGQRVIVSDILLHGECRTQAIPAHQFTMMVSAAGSRLLGIQAAQLAAVVQWSAKYTKLEHITLAGLGPVSSTVALITTALCKRVINRVIIKDAFPSLKLIIEKMTPYEDCPSLFCFGLLEAFDIRELIGLAVPTPVQIVTPVEGQARARKELYPLRELYARFGVMGFQPYWEEWRV